MGLFVLALQGGAILYMSVVAHPGQGPIDALFGLLISLVGRTLVFFFRGNHVIYDIKGCVIYLGIFNHVRWENLSLLLRYCIGLVPNCCLKALEKWERFWNPHLLAMAVSEMSSLAIRWRA